MDSLFFLPITLCHIIVVTRSCEKLCGPRLFLIELATFFVSKENKYKACLGFGSIFHSLNSMYPTWIINVSKKKKVYFLDEKLIYLYFAVQIACLYQKALIRKTLYGLALFHSSAWMDFGYGLSSHILYWSIEDLQLGSSLLYVDKGSLFSYRTMLGFKDLRTNVFRTLICIVGKP